jgi:hypothetical protein
MVWIPVYAGKKYDYPKFNIKLNNTLIKFATEKIKIRLKFYGIIRLHSQGPVS